MALGFLRYSSRSKGSNWFVRTLNIREYGFLILVYGCCLFSVSGVFLQEKNEWFSWIVRDTKRSRWCGFWGIREILVMVTNVMKKDSLNSQDFGWRWLLFYCRKGTIGASCSETELSGSEGIFNNHGLVWTGLSSDGTILVNLSEKEQNWKTKNGVYNGIMQVSYVTFVKRILFWNGG